MEASQFLHSLDKVPLRRMSYCVITFGQVRGDTCFSLYELRRSDALGLHAENILYLYLANVISGLHGILTLNQSALWAGVKLNC